MKKSKILVAALVVLLTTGCGKETKLVCKQSQSGVDVTFNVGFKGNEVTSMDFKYDMDLSSYSDKQIEAIEEQDFCDIVKSSMSGYEDAFTKCDKKVENKHLLVNSELDVDKVAKDEKDKMGSPKDTKKELEKQGYKCTEE